MRRSIAPGSEAFLDCVNSRQFEPFLISHLVDTRGRYQLELDPQFAFAIKLYSFMSIPEPYPLNWHERLELFVPVAGSGRFRMGNQVVSFRTGDLVVVDNMKFHGLVDFRGTKRRAVVVTFAPQLVYTLGSPLCDLAYLVPFHCVAEQTTPLLPADHDLAETVHSTLKRLVEAYFDFPPTRVMQAGCKAYLLGIIYLLARHFEHAEVARSEYLRQQENFQKLRGLFDHLMANCSQKFTVGQAAAMVGMSESRFMKLFKRTTGTTFISYVTQLRLTKACDLLFGTDKSIGEIAFLAGFEDVAYFDRRFKQQFRTSPSAMRARNSGGY